MKIKRFVAKDMRSALEQIKDELGADAVIMSNKKIPEGVELMAAVDNHQSQSQQPAPVQNIMAAAQPESLASKSNADRGLSQDRVTLQNVNQSANPDGFQANDSIYSQIQQTMANGQPAPADSLAALLNRQVQEQQSQANSQINNQPNQTQFTASQPLSSASAGQNINSQSAPVEMPIEEQFKNFTQRLESGVNADVAQPKMAAQTQQTPTSQQYSTTQAQKAPASASQTDSAEIIRMRDEMASIRQLLEHQVAGLMWQDMAQKNPNRALLVNRLQNMGISEQLADQLSGYISAHVNEHEAWQQVTEIIIEQLNTTNNDIIRHGGVVSLVGPTGVGKTTTIAKLAARFSHTHGPDSVALISTDTYRIAGFEQLTTYARIIGCEARLAKDQNELDDLIQHYAHKKLVLIDTAGMGQRDLRLSEYLSTLIANARVRIRNYLVLSANTQQRVMQENVDRFKKIPLAGCIYTKLDESLSFGEIISTSIQNGLPIGYLTDGQRVPEDIKVANAEKLVRLADKMATKYAKEHATTTNFMSTTSTACA
ncbi:MAG: flagellar biosynthesis protein FlhF [Thalassotalea sp.]